MYPGEDASKVEPLNELGLVIRRMDGPIGAASAIKMSFGGITKGLIAIGSAMVLAAHRAGVAEALHAELAASQPAVLAYLTRMVPDMPPKAYRWVAEMEEIAGFTGSEAEREMYEAIAALYERLAQDGAKGRDRRADGFFPESENELIRMPRPVSYSQRFEDLYLGCCFPDQRDGFYIDIGAGHPVYDNVSFAFYERGWRGIAVEPNPWLLQLANGVRPRDRNIQSLVGASRGNSVLPSRQ